MATADTPPLHRMLGGCPVESHLGARLEEASRSQAAPLCLPCSLADVRGADVEAEILRSAGLLREVEIANAAMTRVIGERGVARATAWRGPA